MSVVPPNIGSRLPGLAVPRGRCVPVNTPRLSTGALADLIDVEPHALSCEDAEAVQFARLEGLLDLPGAATTKRNVTRASRPKHPNDKRRTS